MGQHLGTEARKDGGRHETGKGSRNFIRGLLENYANAKKFIGHISWGSPALKNIISFLIFPSPHSRGLRDHMTQLYPDTSPSSSQSNFPCKLRFKGMDFTEFG